MFQEVEKLALAKPPAIILTRNEFESCDSEDDSPRMLRKSKVSLTSTVESPLLFGKKGAQQDEEQESCYQYSLQGACLKGSDCECQHGHQKTTLSNSFMLENYPQLITRKFGRRTLSFLL